MRIAWLGAVPNLESGVRYAATQLLAHIPESVEVDCFLISELHDVPLRLRERPNLKFLCFPTRWRWGRWYSRDPLMAFVSGRGSRLLAQNRIAAEVERHHRERPYDVIYQFSQPELAPGLRRRREALPPIVVHPEVHAAGELRWMLRERRLGRRCTSAPRRHAATLVMAARAVRQRRDLRSVDMVIAPSRRFADALQGDCRVDPHRLRVVANPVDTERYAPRDGRRDPRAPVTVLFASRMSARKGVETVVALTHRLSGSGVRILLAGGGSQWSDYRPLLDDIDTATATYLGDVGGAEMVDLLHGSDVLLQPSHYEPFALTVSEALSCGVAVIVSDKVGASEGVSTDVCTIVRHDDVAGFELAIRTMADRVRRGDQAALGARARGEAVRLFSPGTVAESIVAALSDAAATTPRRRPPRLAGPDNRAQDPAPSGLEERTLPGLHDFLITRVIPAAPDVGAKALDLGAGSGALARRIASMGFDVVAADRDAAGYGGDVELTCIDLDDPSWPERFRDRFQLITAVEVIEHLESPIAFLRGIRSLLAPGGIAVLTTPNMDSAPSRAKFLLKGRLRLMDEYGDPTHISPIFGDLLARRNLPRAGLCLLSELFYPPGAFTTGRPSFTRVFGMLAPFLRGAGLRGDLRVIVVAASGME